jgi:hypothetical protein
MSMEKDGYEVLTDTTQNDRLKIARRREKLIRANSREIELSSFDNEGSKQDRVSGVPCYGDE